MKSRIILLLILELATALPVFSQIQSNGYNELLLNENLLKKHIEYLASDKLEGRKPGSEGYYKAARYVDSVYSNSNLSSFINIGNDSSNYFQDFEIVNYSVSDNTYCIINTRQVVDTLIDNFILFHYGNLKQEIIEGEVVFVGNGIYEPNLGINDFNNLDIKDKWVLMNEDIDNETLSSISGEFSNIYLNPHTSTLRRSIFVNQNEGKGIILRPSKNGLMYWQVRKNAFKEYTLVKNSGSPYRSASIPILLVDSLFNSILTNSPNEVIKVALNKKVTLKEEYSTQNIIGFVRGNDYTLSDEYIIVGAHLDHIGKEDNLVYNGADDNASGSAAVICLSSIIAEKPLKRSVIFVTFSSEELGLLGSYYMSNNLNIDNSQIIAMINIDGIGRSDGSASGIAPIYFNSQRLDWLKELNQIKTNATINWDFGTTFHLKSNSDHFPFYEKGIPCLFLTTGMHSDYHSFTDDADKIDYKFLLTNIEFVYQILRKLDK